MVAEYEFDAAIDPIAVGTYPLRQVAGSEKIPVGAVLWQDCVFDVKTSFTCLDPLTTPARFQVNNPGFLNNQDLIIDYPAGQMNIYATVADGGTAGAEFQGNSYKAGNFLLPLTYSITIEALIAGKMKIYIPYFVPVDVGPRPSPATVYP